MIVGIVNYNTGNIFSVVKKLQQFSVVVKIIESVSEIRIADKLILPGIGHFGKTMDHLTKENFNDELNESVLIKKKPVLGICLGMQLMAEEGEEGSTKGLGWIPGKVIKFRIKDRTRYKIPHIGWNVLTKTRQSTLLKNINEDDEFYFLHAYHWTDAEKSNIICTSWYEYEFASGIECGNIFGIQSHPEKSHKSGEKLLKNFIDL